MATPLSRVAVRRVPESESRKVRVPVASAGETVAERGLRTAKDWVEGAVRVTEVGMGEMTVVTGAEVVETSLGSPE